MQYLIIIAFSSLLCINFAVAADAGPTQTQSVEFAPKNNGYKGQVTFKYAFRNCYSGLHINIDRNSVSSSTYIYNGKSYSPADLGLSSFDKPPIGMVNLWADVYDKGRKLGNFKMSNVTRDTGAGCFGQTYNIAKAMGLDEKAASKRPQDFSLNNFRMETSSRDYKLEKIISEKNKAQETSVKKAAAAAGATKVAAADSVKNTDADQTKTTATAKSTNAATEKQAIKNQQSTTSQQQSIDQKKAAQKQQIENFQKQQAERTKQIDTESKKAVTKVSDAAVNFYKGIQGSNTSVGVSFRYGETTDEQDPFWLGMVFGRYWNPFDPRAHSKWFSGYEFEFAFNSDWLGETTETLNFSTRDAPWKRYNSGFFFSAVTNITSFKAFQFYGSIGYVDAQEFDITDTETDSGWETVTSYGIALNLYGMGLIKLGVNPDMETTDVSFGMMF